METILVALFVGAVSVGFWTTDAIIRWHSHA